MTTRKFVNPVECSIAECDEPVYVRGWCVSHYKRWQRHGDPEAGGRLGDRYAYGIAQDFLCWILEDRPLTTIAERREAGESV